MGFTTEKIKRVSFLYKCGSGAQEGSSLPHKCGVPEARWNAAFMRQNGCQEKFVLLSSGPFPASSLADYKLSARLHYPAFGSACRFAAKEDDLYDYHRRNRCWFRGLVSGSLPRGGRLYR